jgi:hypothetical protein
MTDTANKAETANNAENFTSTRGTLSPVNMEEGSSPRSSQGIYSIKSLFSPKRVSAKLLTVPATISSAAASVAATTAVANGSTPWLRYFLIICVLFFLGLNVFLYLEKPVTSSLTQLYDPVFKWFGYTTEADEAVKKLDAVEQEKQNKEIQKMYSNEKKMEKEGRAKGQPKLKNKPIPVPDDSTSSFQMNKPKSKAGFCYIGEDRGFRSCIEVGEGNVCMSGDIFPSEAVCVNPNLRI